MFVYKETERKLVLSSWISQSFYFIYILLFQHYLRRKKADKINGHMSRNEFLIGREVGNQQKDVKQLLKKDSLVSKWQQDKACISSRRRECMVAS